MPGHEQQAPSQVVSCFGYQIATDKPTAAQPVAFPERLNFLPDVRRGGIRARKR